MNSLLVCIVLLLLSRIECAERSTTAASNVKAAQLKYSQAISLPNQPPIGVLEIYENEEPADALFIFAKKHNLDDRQRNDILNHICRSLTCSRKRALMWGAPVDSNNKRSHFELYEGDEPADAVHQFMMQHGLPENFRSAMMNRVCSSVECKRADPVIWSRTVNIDGNKNVDIIVMRGQEPADAIFAALKPYGVTLEDRRLLFQEAKNDHIPYSREYALLFSQNIKLADNETFSERFVLLDDGTEPVDTVYGFAKLHSIESLFDEIAAAVLPQLCEIAQCTRDRPYVFSKMINNEDGKELGVLSIVLGEEPIDAIDQFFQQHQVDEIVASNRNSLRQKLWEVVCQSIKCSRSEPVVYRRSLNDGRGQYIALIEILENGEASDVVDMFLVRLNTTTEEKGRIKRQILSDACAHERVKCTAAV